MEVATTTQTGSSRTSSSSSATTTTYRVSPTTGTVLPSIRDLHPYLPDPRSLPPPSAYHYPRSISDSPGSSASGHALPYPALRPPNAAVASSQGTEDSEDDEHEPEPEPERGQADPPRKRRRRQALSCTECKRRKIKCDRAHPCTPCVRRNEQSKCQWHQLEPTEKYATRQEYEELKVKFDNLEALVRQLVPNVDLGAHGISPNPHRPRSSSFSDVAHPPQHYPSHPRENLERHEQPRQRYRASPPLSRAQVPPPRFGPNSAPAASPYIRDSKSMPKLSPSSPRDVRNRYWTPSDRSASSTEDRHNHSSPDSK